MNNTKKSDCCHHLKLKHLCHSQPFFEENPSTSGNPNNSQQSGQERVQTTVGRAIKQPGWNVNVWRVGWRTFVSTTGEVECQYLGGVHNSTHKSNPQLVPSHSTFFSSCPPVNKEIVSTKEPHK